ncbi:glycosyltransferase family 8 protein [Nostoc sp. PCC 7107]|uniref:glycosyltransferase family 8 protein n=1 Tax=Nostoc sp. PCC 7107 TaxID=317936 RepID=UPI00029F07E1|nr:glycosyltransferase family 8 protein [Nostoc sp. PCC 7107]AFY40836.1 glycosyl transferase family 8 [Nostoc sp. PCC 7107]
MSISIVCTIDEKYAQHCAVMLSSLFSNNPQQDFNVHIITDSISSREMEKLKLFLDKNKKSFEFISISKDTFRNAPVTHHVSIATYFRLCIPEVLPPNINRVLFIDSDIVIRKPITPLLNINIDNFSHAAAIASGMDDYPPTIGLPQDSLYFNAGLILINLEAWRRLKVFERGCELIRQQPDMLQWWDQDVLNILLHGSWLPIDLTWNSQPFIYDEEGLISSNYRAKYEKFDYLTAQIDPAIVHFVGGGIAKPWYYGCQHPFKDEYLKYLATTPWKNTQLLDKPNYLSKVTADLRFRLGLGSKIRNLLAPLTGRVS